MVQNLNPLQTAFAAGNTFSASSNQATSGSTKAKISSDKKASGKDGSGLSGLSGKNSAIGSEEKEELSFQDLLEQIAPSHKPETRDIHTLWKELPRLERDLIQSRSPDALERYKEQVRALLLAILEKNVAYKKVHTKIPGTMDQKEYTYLEYLDEKLKILAEVIAHPQNSAFQILKKMDNIRGFLLDIQR